MGAVEVRHVARVAVGVTAVLAQIALALFYADWSLFVVPPPVILVLLFLLICGNEKNLVEVDESAEMRDTTGNEICPDATTGATE